MTSSSRADGFDSDFDAYEDLDLYLRLARSGALVPCDRRAGDRLPHARRKHAVGRSVPGTLGVTAKHLAGANGRGRARRSSSGASTRSGHSASSRARAGRHCAPPRPIRRLLGHPRFVKTICVGPHRSDENARGAQMKIALLTEIPAPYRIPLFNALATTPAVELEVLLPCRPRPAPAIPRATSTSSSSGGACSREPGLRRARALGRCSAAARAPSSTASTRTSSCSAAGTSRRSGPALRWARKRGRPVCSGWRARRATSAAATRCSNA